MRKRPLGVAALSLLAFLLAAGLAIFAIYTIGDVLTVPSRDIPLRVELASRTLGVIGLFGLSWSSCVAGRDLWRLRQRGRELAIIGTTIVFVYGAGVYFLSGVLGRVPAREHMARIGEAICVASVTCAAYLALPSVKRSFTPEGAPTS